MAKTMNTHLQFVDGAEIRNIELENLTADPTGAGLRAGRIWHNTTDNLSKYYDGIEVQSFPAAAASTAVTITESPTGSTVGVGGGATDTIPLADATNAGLLSPAEKTILGNTSNTNTGDQTAATVTNTASGNLTSTNVQDSLVELQGDIDALTLSNAADNFIATGGAPAVGDGVDGDYHINVATGDITGPKAAGTWPATGNVGNAFTQLGLADATTATTSAGVAGTATTAARSDHAHASSVFTQQFGDTTTGPFVIAHGFGTANVMVNIRDASGDVGVDYAVDATNVTITPLAAVATNAYTLIANI